MQIDKNFLQSGPHQLEWGRMRTSSPKAILFVPPLIGGNYSQQMIRFRRLVRRNFDLVSYSYSGHGRSSDMFSLQAAIDDTRRMLVHCCRLGEKEQLPIHAIGCCYAAIPLMAALRTLKEPVERLILINAIFELSPGAMVRSFFTYAREIENSPVIIPGLSELFMRYIDFMFPGVVKSRRHFGVLERRRTRLLKTLWDAFTCNPLKSIRLDRTQTLCCYGRTDRILRLYGAPDMAEYEQSVQTLCPKVRFHPLDSGHFLNHPSVRNDLLQHILHFLNLDYS